MYYSELVKKACVIMYDAHKEDKDKGGYPYVFHPFYLATQMDDEESTWPFFLLHIEKICKNLYFHRLPIDRKSVV